MKKQKEVVECADFSQNRLSIGTKSLTRWYQFECDRLDAEVRLFNEELEKETDPQKRSELSQALRVNAVERSELQRDWENSSLRRKLTSNQSAEFSKVETRILTPTHLQVKPTTEKRGGQTQIKLTGYAAVFNNNSEPLGGFVEQIAPGAFTKALKVSDVRALYNHQPDILLGRTTSKTLRLYEDSIGLRFYIDTISNDAISEGITKRIKRGDISGCSFAFTTARDRWELAKKPSDLDVRIIEEVKKLYDVGPVTYPAYPDTSVSVLQEQKSSNTTSEIMQGYRRAGELINRIKDGFKKERDREIAEKYRFACDIIRRNRIEINRDIMRKYRHAGRIINRCRREMTGYAKTG